LRPQSRILGRVQLEHEVMRKAILVALHLLVQTLHWHSVKFGEIAIENNLIAAQDEDARLYRDREELSIAWHVDSLLRCWLI